MLKRTISAMLAVLMLTSSGCFASEKLYRDNCKEQPLYVANCDFAPEYVSWDDGQDEAVGYYPAGMPLYNWCDASDWEAIPEDWYLLDWGGDSTCVPAEYLSFEEPDGAEQPPVFVDYCEEWISVRKKPNYSSERLTKLEIGTRIDHWKACDSEFLYVEIDGYFGYVSLDYVRFPYFTARDESLKIGNCQEWVSLRAEADSESDRLMKVPLGTEITVYQPADGQFYLCAVDGMIGYIHKYYLVKN